MHAAHDAVGVSRGAASGILAEEFALGFEPDVRLRVGVVVRRGASFKKPFRNRYPSRSSRGKTNLEPRPETAWKTCLGALEMFAEHYSGETIAWRWRSLDDITLPIPASVGVDVVLTLDSHSITIAEPGVRLRSFEKQMPATPSPAPPRFRALQCILIEPTDVGRNHTMLSEMSPFVVTSVPPAVVPSANRWTPLVHVADGAGGYPVAWTSTENGPPDDGQRYFATTLGTTVDDFRQADFLRLLYNALRWTCHQTV